MKSVNRKLKHATVLAFWAFSPEKLLALVVTINFKVQTYRGCDHSSIMNGIFLDDELRVFSYAVCKEDLCNKEEEKVTSNGSKNGLENNYFVVITGFLLTVSAIF